MESSSALRGACLCGNVRVSARPKNSNFDACHCAMCRKWGGGPLFAVECHGKAEFEGAEHVSTYVSSEWAERGFCSQCGTHLYYRLRNEEHYAIPLGLFEDGPDWCFAEQIFIDRKPAYYSFSDKTRNLTEEEVFAQHSGD